MRRALIVAAVAGAGAVGFVLGAVAVVARIGELVESGELEGLLKP